jgi:hypothetical protein
MRNAYVASDARLAQQAIRRVVVAELERGANLAQAVEAAARWRVEQTNIHRRQWRYPSNPIADPSVDLFNAVSRGKGDYPTYEMLVERNAKKGLSEAQAQLRMINRTPSRTWTRVANVGKLVGYIGLTYEGGSLVYDVINAKSEERAAVALKGVGSLVGSVSGGYGGFLAGAKIGGTIGATFGPIGALIGAAIGGIIGGGVGAGLGSDLGGGIAGSLASGQLNFAGGKSLDQVWAGPPLPRAVPVPPERGSLDKRIDEIWAGPPSP